MMKLPDPMAFDVLGRPIAPTAPPVLRVVSGEASEGQIADARHAFQRYLMHARLSVVPNPVEMGRLPDGSSYKIITVGGVRTMLLWAEDGGAPLGTVDSGVVFRTFQGKTWLLVNAPTQGGGASMEWRFRDITDDYPDGALGVFTPAQRTVRLPKPWRYSYQSGGLGRFGHLEIYSLYGNVAHVTSDGYIISLGGRSNKVFYQGVATPLLGQLQPPAFGNSTNTQIDPVEVDGTASTFISDAAEVGPGTQLSLPAPQLHAGYPYALSTTGKFMAAEVRRDTGETASRIVQQLGDNNYVVRVPNDPVFHMAVVGQEITLTTRTSSGNGVIAKVYAVEENAAKVYSASNSGYALDSEVVLERSSSFTPTIGTSAAWQETVYAPRFGVQVSGQFWPDPNRISSFSVTDTSPQYITLSLMANHSETYGFNVSRNKHSIDTKLEGVADDGTPLTYREETSEAYNHQYSRPTTTNRHYSSMVPREGYTPPTIGVSKVRDYPESDVQTGTFLSVVDSTKETVRTYEDIELVTSKSVLHATHSGTFYRALVEPGNVLDTVTSYSSTTSYTSRVERREVIYRDPAERTTVFVESIATVSHTSSTAGANGVTTSDTPSTSPPDISITVWVCKGSKRISIDIPDIPEVNRHAGILNIGKAVYDGLTLNGRNNPAGLERAEPIGVAAWYTAPWVPKSDFIYDGQGGLVIANTFSNSAVTVRAAKCPETGGALLRVAGRLFLVDDAGVRDAENVLEWPSGLAEIDFATF